MSQQKMDNMTPERYKQLDAMGKYKFQIYIAQREFNKASEAETRGEKYDSLGSVGDILKSLGEHPRGCFFHEGESGSTYAQDLSSRQMGNGVR